MSETQDEKDARQGQSTMFALVPVPAEGQAPVQVDAARVSRDKVFETVKSEKGVVTIKLQKTKQIGINLSLTAKSQQGARDAEVRKQSDRMLLDMKAEVAGLDETHTFHSAKMTPLKGGLLKKSFHVVTIDRNATTTTLAEAAKALGITVKELQAKIDEQRVKERIEAAKSAKAEGQAPKEKSDAPAVDAEIGTKEQPMSEADKAAAAELEREERDRHEAEAAALMGE
jgi:hypothetical protein